MLRKIGNKLERLEEEIFEGNSAEVVRDISNVKQEIINFRKIVRPQRSAVPRPRAQQARYIAEDLEIYFEDINDASERVWDMLENYKEVVEALEDTNESAIAHRTNETFRVLTAISVIVLPLTLVASIWGMNVGVPGEHDMTAFWAIIGFMAVLLGGMIAYFRRRGWCEPRPGARRAPADRYRGASSGRPRPSACSSSSPVRDDDVGSP
jgi:magnesium transporter